MPTQVLPAQVPEKAVATDTISLTEYNNFADSISELIGRSGGNLLVCGGMETWQRGVGPFTADGAYGPDRWQQHNGSAASVTITQETSTIVTNSRYALKCVGTGSGSYSSSAYIEQKIDPSLVYELRGKSISLSVRVQQSVASKVGVQIEGNLSTTAAASASATTGSYVTYTCTMSVNSAETALYVRIYFGGAGTYYVDNAMLVLGPNPTEYVPLHPQEELARCQRYYEIIHAEMIGSGVAGEAFGYHVPYKVKKATTSPTVTKVGTWTVTNCGQPTSAREYDTGVTIYAVATATGLTQFFSSSGGSIYFTVESNP